MGVLMFRLPHLELFWRWPRLVSPYLSEIERECLEWSASFKAFDPDTQRLVHEKGKLSKLRPRQESSGMLSTDGDRSFGRHVLRKDDQR